MKETIKIGLIALTAAVIVGLLYYFTDRITVAGAVRIETTPFTEYVEQSVNHGIVDKPYPEAKASFYKLMDELQTESFVWLNDSTRALAKADSVKCVKMAFFAYVPIFASYGSQYFDQSIWTIQMTDELRKEANALLAFKIAENGSQVKNDLDQILKNVNDYHSALGVVKNASSCGSVDAVNKSIEDANKYKRSPLTNNTMLQKDLNNVPSVAKEALANKLVASSSSLIANKCDYGDYQRWYELYTNMIESIEKYEKTFEKLPKLTAEKTKLAEADEEALDCYD